MRAATSNSDALTNAGQQKGNNTIIPSVAPASRVSSFSSGNEMLHPSGIAPSAHFPVNRIAGKPAQLRILIDADDDKKYKHPAGSTSSVWKLLPQGRLTLRRILIFIVFALLFVFLLNAVFSDVPKVSAKDRVADNSKPIEEKPVAV